MLRLNDLAAEFDPTPAANRRSWLSRVRAKFSRSYAVMIAAQEARAKRITMPYLARRDDADLMRLGFSTEEIAVIRRNASRHPRMFD
jgi:hypothetical protein